MTGILVTGSHRSGTTWVGRLLAQSPGVVYLQEPFNPQSTTVGGALPRFRRWFQYVCADNANIYRAPVDRVFDFRYRPFRRAVENRGRMDIRLAIRTQREFRAARLSHAMPLLKDPIAVFSAPWLADTYGLKVVVLVRHPLAFASSLKLLKWQFDFRDWAEQPLLIRDHLGGFREELTRACHTQLDFVDQAVLLWNGIHSALAQMQQERPDWHFLRHEDISRSPSSAFERLAHDIGLVWGDAEREGVLRSANPLNPVALDVQNPHSIARRSESLPEIWRTRLTASEAERVIAGTYDAAQAFYRTVELNP